MKKNFITVVAVAVTALLVGASIAQAVSVEWGGQLRPRFEYNEQFAFNSSELAAANNPNQGTRDGDYFVSTRIRLNAKVDILPDTSAFIQLQSVRTWGEDGGGTGANAGSGNASFTASDADASVGIHQAYFTLKNFFTLPVDLKMGRQQIVLDGHRLLGHTGWTQGAQTHDALRLTHSGGNHTLAYAYIIAREGARGTSVGTNANDAGDVEVHVGYANMQGILGGGLSLYFIALDDDNTGAQTTVNILDNNNYTVGARQAGQLFGINYRGEFYYQFGDAEGSAVVANTGAAGIPYVGSDLVSTDRSAYMFGARIGKKFKNVMWKPSLTLWYDYLSGTSDEDARDGDFQSFNTLFDTGHKFYGFMDLFLGIGGGAQNNSLGLVDYAIKTSVQPAKGWTMKADWHYFTTAESVQANTNFSGATVGSGDDNALGNELDLTLVHKYNANTTISAGYSQFWQESAFELLGGQASSTATVTPATWAYLQFDVKF